MQSLKAFQPCAAPPRRAIARSALQIQCRISRVGKAPIPIPKGVTITLDGSVLKVKGPLGALEQSLSPLIKIEQDATKLLVQAADESKEAMKMHGLHRTLVNNMVVGVSAGFTKKMDLVGTGYRAAVTGKELSLNVGYNKPRVLAIPEGLKVAIEKQVAMSVTGYDKVAVGDFCATVRRQRPPEPYKGKGIRDAGEIIKLKEGKGAGGKKK